MERASRPRLHARPTPKQVTELIISELLYLQNESQEKPVLMYINSPGTTTEDGQPTGFESEAFAIYDTMNYCKAPVHTVLRPLLPPCPYRPAPAPAPVALPLSPCPYPNPYPYPLPPSPNPNPKQVLVGKAYGLAAMLLAAGVKGKRSTSPTPTLTLALTP